MKSENSEHITFRLPAYMKEQFLKRHLTRGKRSRILRGLLQMHLNGKIPTVVYKTETRET